jgi:hypothetical protein
MVDRATIRTSLMLNPEFEGHLRRGARFLTQQTKRYIPGQSLEMTIHLPATNELKACINGRATVVRIEQLGIISVCKKGTNYMSRIKPSLFCVMRC